MTQSEPDRERGFLADNWLWIVVPAAIFLIVIAALFLLGGDSSSPFMYNIFG